MRKCRRSPTQGVVDSEVLGRRYQPLRPTKDVTDSHRVIIHHVGQVVGGKAVRLDDNEVAFVEGRGDGAQNHVFEAAGSRSDTAVLAA